MRDKVFDHGEISGFLDEGTSFNGELTFRNTMRIDGKFKGSIKSKNVLIVGETAEIDGEVEVSNVSINGKVSGKLKAEKKIEIHSKGKVYCDIDTPKLVIEDGAFFQGNCNMKETGKPGNPGLVVGHTRPEPSDEKDRPGKALKEKGK